MKQRKVFVRKSNKNDWKYFKKWWTDKYLISLTSGDYTVYSKEKLYDWFLNMLKKNDSKNFVVLNENKIVIGHMVLEIKEKKGEFNIVIGSKKYMGKGYGTLATKKIISLGFKKYGLNKIFLEVRPENIRAIRAYEKSGFVTKRIKTYKNPNRSKVVVMEIRK